MLDLTPRSISAVIPTYNRGGRIGAAVESALAQRRPVDEVIVVDDGSTDETPAALARFGDAIRVIRQDNAGVSAARRAGLRAARSRWVACLDSDDVWRPDAIARHVAALDDAGAETKVEVVFGNVVARTDAGLTEDLMRTQGFEAPTPRIVEDAVACCHPVMLPMLQSSLVDREAALATGAFEEDLRASEDFLLFVRLALRGPFLAHDAVVAEIARTEDLRASSLSRQAGAPRDDDARARMIAFREIAAVRPGAPWRRLHAEHVRAWRLSGARPRGFRLSMEQLRAEPSARSALFVMCMLGGRAGERLWRELRGAARGGASASRGPRRPFHDRIVGSDESRAPEASMVDRPRPELVERRS